MSFGNVSLCCFCESGGMESACPELELLGNEIRSADPSRLADLAKKVLAFAEKALEGDRDELAQETCSKALKLTDGVTGLAGVRAEFTRLLANHHFKHGRLKESLEKNLDAAELMLAGGNYIGAAVVYGNCGALLHNLGDKATAYEYQLKVLDLSEKHGLEQQKARALVNIAMILKSRREYHSALVMLERAMDVFASLTDRTGVSYSLDGIAQMHGKLGNSRESLSCHREALRIRKELGNQYEVLLSLINMASALLDARLPKQAREICGEALVLAETGLKPNLKALVLLNLAKSHLDLGSPDEALRVLNECEEMYSMIPGYHSTKSEMKRVKARALALLGRHSEAYEVLSEVVEMEEDLHSEIMDDELSRIRIAAEVKTCLREREIEADATRRVTESEKRLKAALEKVRQLEKTLNSPPGLVRA